MSTRLVSPLAALLLVGTLAAPALPLAAQATPAQKNAAPQKKATPPAPAKAEEIHFPAFEQKTLANGLQVVAIEQHETPSVSVQIILPAGKLYEPAAKAGLAAATASLLTQGTAKRSAQQIAQAIDFIGGNLSARSTSDAGRVSVRVTSDQLDTGLDLLADVVLHPSFPADEIERWRQQALSGLQIQQNDPGYLANAAFARAVFGDHPYGQPSAGTPESVRGLTRDDLVAFHRQHFLPNGAILAIVGDVKAADAFARAERFFGGWPKGEAPKPPAFQATARKGQKIVVVDKPDAVQTQVVVGKVTVPYNDPQFFAAEVYNSVVGGGSNARLYDEVRTKRGLTYGAYSGYDPRRQAGLFIASTSTKTESTVPAAEQVVAVLQGMTQKPVPPSELEGRKSFITGAFPLEIETPEGIAAKVVEAMFYGLGQDFLEHYRDRINAVTAADVQRFAAGPANPGDTTIVLVGNAASFAADLQKQLGAFETIPATDLDLLRADLRRPKEASPAAAPASDADRAKALTILGQARQAMGGQAFAGQKTQVSKGTGSVSPPGAPQPMALQSVVTYEIFPNKTRTEMALPMGTLIQTFDGQTGWVSIMNQVQDQTAQLKDEQYYGINVLRRFDQAGYQARILPDAEVNGKKAQVVAVADEAGHTTRFFLDPQSHLVLQTASELPNGAIETLYSDYKAVDGIQVPYTLTIRQNGAQVAELKLTEVQINPKVDEGLFTKPQS